MAYAQRERSTMPLTGEQVQNRAGRPKGPPSTIVNVRLPLDLVAQLDRYLDWMETQAGKSVNRSTITRQALQEFLERHAVDIT